MALSNEKEMQLPGIIESGRAAFASGNYREALKYFTKYLEIDATNSIIWNDLGLVQIAIKNYSEALESFKQAVRLKPSFAAPFLNLGILSKNMGDLAKAEMFYMEALKRQPIYAEACYNLGLLKEEEEKNTFAESWYRKAIDQRPHYLQAENNLGVLITKLGRNEEAVRFLISSIRYHKTSPEMFTSLGTALQQIGRIKSASGAYHKALELDSELSEAKWNLALIELGEERYREGWENFRYRPGVNRERFAFPNVRLEKDLTGHTFEIYGEQGLGDVLFFSRFIRGLLKRGANIRCKFDKRIEYICKRALNCGETTALGKPLSIADLPFLLDIDESVPSLEIDVRPRSRKKISDILQKIGPPPYIGLTYRAGQREEGLLYKEIELERLINSLCSLDATFINLQRNIEEGENERIAEKFRGQVADLSYLNDNLEDMLAIMLHLDEYIGVSNTNMHLRLAVGKTSRVLVTYPSEYRWMQSGMKSPWFPNFDLYRQLRNLSWEPALLSLKADLKRIYV